MNYLHPYRRLSVEYYIRLGWPGREIQKKTGVNRGTILAIARTMGKQRDDRKVPKAPFITRDIAEAMLRAEDTRTIGFCSCGCGQRTTIIKHDDKKRGLKAGDSGKWVATHWAKFRRECLGPDYKSHVDRQQERDAIRKEMDHYLYHNRFVSRDDIYEKFADRGFRKDALGVILSTLIGYSSYTVNEDELEMPPRRQRPPAPPRYERRFIPYEKETELPLLTAQRRYLSLDDSQESGGSTLHERLSRFAHGYSESCMVNAVTPFDILAAKDDREQEEREAYPLILRTDYAPAVQPEGFGAINNAPQPQQQHET